MSFCRSLPAKSTSENLDRRIQTVPSSSVYSMKTRFIAYFGSKIKDENTMRTRTLAVHIGASNRTVLVSLVDQRITFIDAVNFLFGEIVYVDALGEIIMKLYIKMKKHMLKRKKGKGYGASLYWRRPIDHRCSHYKSPERSKCKYNEHEDSTIRLCA